MVSPLPSIVSLTEAKSAAFITTSDGDADLALRLELAHELCLDYLDNRIDDDEDWLATILAWDETNAPRRVKGAILSTFVYLQRFRGDDNDKENQVLEHAQLPAQVRMMLDRLRDPTVA